MFNPFKAVKKFGTKVATKIIVSKIKREPAVLAGSVVAILIPLLAFYGWEFDEDQKELLIELVGTILALLAAAITFIRAMVYPAENITPLAKAQAEQLKAERKAENR
jgi:hypothetical protein